MVVCKLPDGFKVPGYIIEVDRALYGLRDSPTLWFKYWTDILKRIGLSGLNEEPCICMDTDYKVFIVFYIDDFQVLYYKDDEVYTQSIIA
jgi:hypothetical protein